MERSKKIIRDMNIWEMKFCDESTLTGKLEKSKLQTDDI